MPLRVVSKNSSSVSFSFWPATNWSTGESRPGIAISAYCAPLANVRSVGLNWTVNDSGRPRSSSIAAFSLRVIVASSSSIAYLRASGAVAGVGPRADGRGLARVLALARGLLQAPQHDAHQ